MRFERLQFRVCDVERVMDEGNGIVICWDPSLLGNYAYFKIQLKCIYSRLYSYK